MDCQTETNKVLNTYINIFVDYIQMITFTTLYYVYAIQLNSKYYGDKYKYNLQTYTGELNNMIDYAENILSN